MRETGKNAVALWTGMGYNRDELREERTTGVVTELGHFLERKVDIIEKR
jgi:hypothetical protein